MSNPVEKEIMYGSEINNNYLETVNFCRYKVKHCLVFLW